MALRGFDDYKLTLGDEMRGERACLGKSLGDAERDLCIKADMLSAIENADIEAFPNRSVVPGYVRSYARYLSMDPEHCYERFCEESGFRSPLATFGMVPDPAANSTRSPDAGARAAVGIPTSGLTQSRFAYAPRARRIGAPISLGGVFSVVALIGLVGGIGYGGYALVQDIQRVGFAPLPEAPAVVADAPVISAPAIAQEAVTLSARPDASAYSGGGALALATPAELPAPAMGRRDGPISAIDPATSGVFAKHLDLPRSPRAAGGADDRPLAVFATVTPVEERGHPGFGAAVRQTEPPADTAEGAAVEAPDHVALVIADEAWLRVRDAAGAVLFEGLLKPGDRFEVPDRADAPVLHVGNAGGVYVTVGGILHGPVGAPGKVVKNFSLVPADLRGSVPVASGLPDATGHAAGDMRSASAEIQN
ncbi:DUF4115 domain-containing protein [Limibaculum sp. M0105]|uniref:DUF4115 domain-containing protein n=1 Tax=Thermohalobaculum xanthum TaxID=2753746 RepID=A0A8J7SDG4_9RHOB|nr:RodZ domain-containing protein [Thermohalobaculum xanthum]MBK0398412.1 DUF4115 domain-containing protein [Thermohalobaculum xanthum]